MRMRCNHTFHQTCWEDHVRVFVSTQNGGWASSNPEPPCAICRAPGIISSVFPWIPQFMDPLESAAEVRRLREELSALKRQMQDGRDSRGDAPASASRGDAPAAAPAASPPSEEAEVRAPMRTGYFERLIEPAPDPLATHFDPARGMVRPPAEEGGSRGDAPLTGEPSNDAPQQLGPQELRQQRMRFFQQGAGRGSTVLMLDGNSTFSLSSESTQVYEHYTNQEFQDWLDYCDFGRNVGLEDMTIDDYVKMARPTRSWLLSRQTMGETRPPTLFETINLQRSYLDAWNKRGDTPGINMATVHIKQPGRTFMEDGGNSVLIDVGSNINIIGSNTSKKFEEAAAAAGRTTTFENRPRLNINGVGSGSAPADTAGTYDIACDYQGRTQHDTFKANVVTGSGKDLPAILGLDSMQEKRALLILEKGEEKLVLPGPGPVKIHWPVGTKVLPLEKLPSGHLAMRCDKYAQASAGQPASGAAGSAGRPACPTTFTMSDEPEVQHGEGSVPPELIRTMAYAAARGVPLSDLETWEEWQERLKAESPGEDMVISHEQVERRKSLLMQFSPSDMQLVSEARASGLLTRLQTDPQFLSHHVSEQSEHARQRALDESKRLMEYTMLNSIRAPVEPMVCGPCGSASHRDRAARGPSSSSD